MSGDPTVECHETCCQGGERTMSNWERAALNMVSTIAILSCDDSAYSFRVRGKPQMCRGE